MTSLGRAHDANLPSGVRAVGPWGALDWTLGDAGPRLPASSVVGPKVTGGVAHSNRETDVRTHVTTHDSQQGADAAPGMQDRDLEQRVGELEKQVVALAAAVDAASRMQVATPRRVDQDIRLAGGRPVRRILEKTRLIEDYRETRRAG